MASFVKTKAGISVFSLAVLILIPLLESNFNMPVTLKRWGPLTWDDFQGLARPFSKYGAGVHSGIYLEYDSSANTYHAYAAQNNAYSWTKGDLKYPDYGLRHEQYHFNITELHARLLNKFIATHPGKKEQAYMGQLKSINIALEKMQTAYDQETDHSIIADRQRHWEFKIDSMLVQDSGWVTDKYSGATFYLPTKYTFSKGLYGEGRYRDYGAVDYKMRFSVTSYQSESFDYSIIYQMVNDYRLRQLVLRDVRFEPEELATKVSLIAKDSTNGTSRIIWLKTDKYLYNVSVRYPNDHDTTGYYEIAKSFLNSFKIVDTDSLWLAEMAGKTAPENYSRVTDIKGNQAAGKQNCLTLQNNIGQAFYRSPIFTPENDMIIPYDYIMDDSLRQTDILLFNKRYYSSEPASDGNIFIIPANQMPPSPPMTVVSYSMQNDPTIGCKPFYHQILKLTGTEHRIDSTAVFYSK